MAGHERLLRGPDRDALPIGWNAADCRDQAVAGDEAVIRHEGWGRKTAKRVRQRILAVCVYAIAKGQAAAPADAASGVSGSGVRIVSLTPWLRL